MFDLPRTDPHADALLNDTLLEARLGMPLQTVLADNGALFSNPMAQPLIVAATMATWEALRQHVPTPALVAGYSIGEVAAYGVAGALAPVDAVALAALPARYCSSAAFPWQSRLAKRHSLPEALPMRCCSFSR